MLVEYYLSQVLLMVDRLRKQAKHWILSIKWWELQQAFQVSVLRQYTRINTS